MKDKQREAELLNKLDVDEVELVLPVPSTNATSDTTSVNATVNATVKLNKTQEKIIAILRVDKFATYDVISKQLGVERTTVWRNIKKLQDIGRLRREGGDKDGYWKTIE